MSSSWIPRRDIDSPRMMTPKPLGPTSDSRPTGGYSSRSGYGLVSDCLGSPVDPHRYTGLRSPSFSKCSDNGMTVSERVNGLSEPPVSGMWSAASNRCSTSMPGLVAIPRSSWPTQFLDRPARSANSCCDRPARMRASRIRPPRLLSLVMVIVANRVRGSLRSVGHT